jgi:hypothetical protein
MQRHITLVFMPIHLSPEGLRVLGIFYTKGVSVCTGPEIYHRVVACVIY